MTTTIATRPCPDCNAIVPLDDDFCPNGHYVAWESLERGDRDLTEPGSAAGALAPERAPSAPAPLPLPPPAPSPVQPGAMGVVLDVAPAADPPRSVPAGVHASTPAGQPVALLATLRNIGDVVDDYMLQVRGLPAGWVSVHEPAAHLLPMAQQRDFERRLAITLLPPLAPESAAGVWEFTVTVTSTARGGAEVARQPCSLEVLGFTQVDATAKPAITRGWRTAHFKHAVHNHGNRDVIPVVVGEDAEAACTFETSPVAAAIAPGGRQSYAMQVKAPKWLWIGRPLDRPLTVSTQLDGADVALPQIVTFRQRPIVPWWVVALLGLLLAVAAFVYTQLPHKVTTPLLKGAKSAFVAQGQLQDAGFKAPPTVQTRVLARPAAGTVFDQRPRAGTKVAADTVVVIRVAVPPTTTIIPDLRGLTTLRADAVLSHARLALGNVVPGPNAKNPIVSQIPRAGTVKPRNTMVNVVLADSPPLPIPDLTCMTAGTAEKVLNAKGFNLVPVPTFVSPDAHARGQSPLPKQKRKPGAQVTLIFNGPPPLCPAKNGAKPRRLGAARAAQEKKKKQQSGNTKTGAVTSVTAAAAAAQDSIAYSAGGTVRLGGTSQPFATGTQPAWSAAGSLLAMVNRDAIVVTRPRDSARPVARIAIAGSSLAAPAFAPIDDTPVVAFTATPGAGGETRLCFARLVRRAPSSSCRPIGDLQSRALEWSPDARELVLVAATAADPSRPGLRRYATFAGGDSDASAWRAAERGLVRPDRLGRQGSVFDAAFMPGGQELAIVTDVRPDGRLAPPQVVLAPVARLRDLGTAKWLRVPGCSLDVSPAGSQLIVGSPGDRGICDETGALAVVPVDDPRARVRLALEGGQPAWGG
jgi:beta-lactam-binding protein with PASTA domain